MKNKEIYNQIQQLLDKRGVSVSWLCRQIGMSDNGYVYMRKNDTLKVSTLIDISKVLEISPSVFFKESKNDKILNETLKNTKKILNILQTHDK